MPPVPAAQEIEPHAWGADAGTELYGPRHDYRESLLLRRLRGLLPPSPGAQAVLNAGCGAGSFTLKLLDAGYAVTSVDASEPFVASLRARLAGRGVDAPVDVADVAALPFPDGSFAGVVCGEVLEHVDDDRAAARELRRVLRPGGALVASVPANPWRYDWVDWWAGHRRRYTSAALRELLEQAGFVEVEVVAWGFPLTGLYERLVYKRLLRRRLTSNGAAASGGPSRGMAVLGRIARAAFELDSLFEGRRPGYLGLIATARAASAPAQR
jgi:SAM-dependent methyltransferase